MKENDPEAYRDRCEKQRRLTPEGRATIAEASSKKWKGVPKTEAQKKLMSKAKLNVPKSEEHKAAMALAHINRSKQIHMLQMEYNMYYRDAVGVLRDLRKEGKTVEVDDEVSKRVQRANAHLRFTCIKNPNKNEKLKTLFTMSLYEALKELED